MIGGIGLVIIIQTGCGIITCLTVIRKGAVIPDLGSNKIQLAADLASKKIDQIAPSLQRFNDVGMRGHVTSACSPTMYRDHVLFDDDQQHVFVSEPVHNLVRHFVLKRDGY
jgi:hypothetical protein